MIPHEGGGDALHTDGLEQIGGIDCIAPEVRSFPLRLFISRHEKCTKCPQYGEVIIYKRKCYYGMQCGWPVFIQIVRLNRILAKRVKDARDFSLSMYGKPKCPDGKHQWKTIRIQPKWERCWLGIVLPPAYHLSWCENCGKIEEESP